MLVFFLPEVEAVAEHGLAGKDSACVCGFAVVHDGNVEFAGGTRKQAPAVPHHRHVQAVVKRE